MDEGSGGPSDEISALKARIEELERSVTRYRTFFDSAPIPLWDEDWSEIKQHLDALRRSGVQDLAAHFDAHPEDVARCANMIRVLDVNYTTLALHGAASREQFLSGITQIFAPSTPDNLRKEILALAGGATTYEGETELRGVDGRLLRLLIKIVIPPGYEQSWGRVFIAFLDLAARIEAEEARSRALVQEGVIQAQRDALGALSTPVIPISDDTLVMPLVGVLDSQRMSQVHSMLLEEISRRRATTAIVDITGVGTVDSAVADMLLRAARAVRLLGAKVILTGIRPEVAQVLVAIGVDLAGIVTHGTLQAGIAHARRPENAT